MYKNIGKAFSSFEEAEQKRKTTTEPETLKKNLQEKVFTAVEQTYNNIPKGFNHKRRLTDNLDRAMREAADYDSFIGLMQEAGYDVKFDGKKGLAFKDDKMERFMYAKSISLDYTEGMIKYRIKNRKEPPETVKKRTVYDDKIKPRNKRKKLKAEIDASIKKSNTFEEFTEDMERKNFEVKLGAHIAFRDLGQPSKDGAEPRFLRGKSLGYHYTEEAIKFRIVHKEIYKKMINNKIEKIIPIFDKDDADLISWKKGNNGNILNASERWIAVNLLERNNIDYKVWDNGKIYNNELFGLFLEEYDKQKKTISSAEEEVKNFTNGMADVKKHIRGIESYWALRPELERYSKKDLHNLTESETRELTSIMSKWRYATGMLQSAEEKYGTVSTKELWNIYDRFEENKEGWSEKVVELKLDFETWENVMYNFTHKNGEGFCTEKSVESARRAWENRKIRDAQERQKQAEKAERREARKESVKKFLGLSK